MIADDARLTAAIADNVAPRHGDTVRLLQDFVRVPCVTGDEGAVQEVVAAALAESHLTVERVSATPEMIAPYHDHVGEETRFANRPNIVGIRRGTGGGRSILLNAHVDTVEVGDPATWTREPLGGEILADRLTPRHIIGDTGVYLRWQHNWQVRAAGLAPESRFARRGLQCAPELWKHQPSA